MDATMRRRTKMIEKEAEATESLVSLESNMSLRDERPTRIKKSAEF